MMLITDNWCSCVSLSINIVYGLCGYDNECIDMRLNVIDKLNVHRLHS